MVIKVLFVYYFFQIPATLTMYFAIQWFYFDSKWFNNIPAMNVFVAGVHHFKVLFNQFS